MRIKKTDGGNIKIVLTQEEFAKLEKADGKFNEDQSLQIHDYVEQGMRTCSRCAHIAENSMTQGGKPFCRQKSMYKVVNLSDTCKHFTPAL